MKEKKQLQCHRQNSIQVRTVIRFLTIKNGKFEIPLARDCCKYTRLPFEVYSKRIDSLMKEKKQLQCHRQNSLQLRTEIRFLTITNGKLEIPLAGDCCKYPRLPFEVYSKRIDSLLKEEKQLQCEYQNKSQVPS